MGKHIYIDGGLIVTTGNLYARNISAGGSWHPDDAEIIVPPSGWWEITKDTGSIFDSYYVSGPVVSRSISGISEGRISAFFDDYNFTVKDYTAGLAQIESMLEIDIPELNKALYFQQQYATVFSLLEQFLSCTFIRQTCDREDSYKRVVASGELLKWSTAELNNALKGPDCLVKELSYIDAANRVIYHNASRVGTLFKTAFGIDVDLSVLDKHLEVRNHISHRFGHTKEGLSVSVSKSDVRSLMSVVDKIVKNTIGQIQALPKSESMYPLED